METKTKFIKSPLNYTGGKYKLLSQIVPLFPNDINTFVDLFAGGCNVCVNISSKRVIASDCDQSVIDIFKAFQNTPTNELIQYIEATIEKYGLNITDQEAYNRFRNDYNNGERNPLDLFILICYSFNHQIRFNRKGEFNMPFGKDRSQWNKNIKKNLIEFKESIKDIVFICKDFVDLKIEKLKSDDFVYCDPPYLITCATYNEKNAWTEKEEKELLALLDKLNEKGIKFALSNVMENKGQENTILKEWSQKYTVHHLSNTYSNCNYHAKDKDKNNTDEVLIVNYGNI